jgi:hypothetical protein
MFLIGPKTIVFNRFFHDPKGRAGGKTVFRSLFNRLDEVLGHENQPNVPPEENSSPMLWAILILRNYL